MEMGLKEVIYGILAIVLIVTVIWGGIKYIPSANKLFHETVGSWDMFLDPGVKTNQEKFKIEFQDNFLDNYKECRDSKNSNCWCDIGEFEIPFMFSLGISRDEDNTNFILYNNKDVQFIKDPYVTQEVKPCFIVDGTVLDLGGKELKIQESRGFNILFKQDKIDINEKVSLPNLFYKYGEGRICVVAESSLSTIQGGKC